MTNRTGQSLLNEPTDRAVTKGSIVLASDPRTTFEGDTLDVLCRRAPKTLVTPLQTSDTISKRKLVDYCSS